MMIHQAAILTLMSIFTLSWVWNGCSPRQQNNPPPEIQRTDIPPTSPTSPIPPTPPVSPAETQPQSVSLEIGTSGDSLTFDKTTLAAKPGQAVKLTFHNNASKTSALQHNWVLVKTGTENDVAQAAMQAGAEKGWLPDSPNILAHTKMINPGESDEISFRAPSTSGSYPYLCSFPGHATTMKGTLEVK